MTARHFGIQSRRMTSGAVDSHPPAYGARNTGAGSNSSYRPLPQGSLHRENITDSPVDLIAGVFVTTFLISVGLFCLGLYLFLRAVGL